eukprot:766691-Hanusia_phi.AAC.4
MLFSFKPQSGLAGQAFIQLMPDTSDGKSLQTYKSWESLSSFVQLDSFSTIDGRITTWPLSKWGYTGDGVAGLQVEVDTWDPNTDVYVEVAMRGEALPADKFSMIIYHLGSVLELWKVRDLELPCLLTDLDDVASGGSEEQPSPFSCSASSAACSASGFTAECTETGSIAMR